MKKYNALIIVLALLLVFSIYVAANSDFGESDTFSIDTKELTSPPSISAISDISIAEDSTATFIVNFTDNDIGETFTMLVESDNDSIKVSPYDTSVQQGTGYNVTLAPDPNYFGTANIKVKVTDSNNNADSAIFVITVTSVNDPPVLVKYISDRSINKGGSTPIDVMFSDPDKGDLYTIAINTNDGSFSVDLDNPLSTTDTSHVFTFTPDSDFSGTMNITVVVTDSGNSAASTQFVLTVNDPGAEGPEISLSTASLNFGLVTIGDSCFNRFTISNSGDGELNVTNISSSNSSFTISPSSYSIPAGTNKVVWILYKPSASSDQTANITISSNDSDEGTLTITASGTGFSPQGTNFALSSIGGSVTASSEGTFESYFANKDYLLDGTIQYEFSPGVGSTPDSMVKWEFWAADTSSVLPVSLTITLNDKIKINHIKLHRWTADFDWKFNIDGSLDSLNYSSIKSEELFVKGDYTHLIDLPGNQAQYVRFTFTEAEVNQTGNNLNLQTSELEIWGDPVVSGTAPVITPILDQTTSEEVSKLVTIDFSDPDPGDSWDISISSDNENVTISPPDTHAQNLQNRFEFIPAKDYYGESIITVTVTDSKGLSDSDTFKLKVFNVNDLPVLNPLAPVHVDQGNSKTVIITYSDPDPDDNHTFEMKPDTNGITITQSVSNKVEFTIVPNPGYSGNSIITATVTDDSSASDIKTFICTVRESGEFSIIDITDIANDQGRQVRVSWNRHPYDITGSQTKITQYSIWRQIDSTLADKFNKPAVSVEGWDYVSTIPALQSPVYSDVCPTLADSTVNKGIYYSVFKIVAQSDYDNWESPQDRGYSVDNLSPEPITNFKIEYISEMNYLSWEKIFDTDFSHFTVHRSQNEDYVPDESNRIGRTDETSFGDSDVILTVTYYYSIVSYDYSGNRTISSPLEIVTNIESGNISPTKYVLQQNFPNPFNPVTEITYQIPKTAFVNLEIFNNLGVKIRTLVNGTKSAGNYIVSWNSKDDNGLSVPSGLYFYRIKAGTFSDVKKMVFMK